MSSPIASQEKNLIKDILRGVHQKFSHGKRVEILSRKISFYIDRHFSHAEEIRCLDVGCGDMQIAEHVSRYNQKTVWNCIDIHDLPEELKNDSRWAKYRKFDGLHIPFPDRYMDVVLMSDVLHHDLKNALSLMREGGRAGKILIIKDHLEYSFYSRFMLKAMDFIGNWGYGIRLPQHYFTLQEFQELCRSAGLTARSMDIGIDLYKHLFLPRWLLNPAWHFIAVLES